MNKTTSKRLLALDILRGITIAGMIMVNNPGSWSYVYAPLGHAQWNGLTPTDLVFPFFMFIMGISTYISLRKYNFEFSHSAALKILKRTIVIFAIGLGLAWFSMFCRTWNSLSAEEISFFSRLGQSIWTFDHIRILGVMQRLALCYGATAIVALTMKHKHINTWAMAGIVLNNPSGSIPLSLYICASPNTARSTTESILVLLYSNPLPVTSKMK